MEDKRSKSEQSKDPEIVAICLEEPKWSWDSTPIYSAASGLKYSRRPELESDSKYIYRSNTSEGEYFRLLKLHKKSNNEELRISLLTATYNSFPYEAVSHVSRDASKKRRLWPYPKDSNQDSKTM